MGEKEAQARCTAARGPYALTIEKSKRGARRFWAIYSHFDREQKIKRAKTKEQRSKSNRAKEAQGAAGTTCSHSDGDSAGW